MRKLRRLYYTKPFTIIRNGFVTHNPIYAMGLGICSALAITNRVENALAMGLSVTFVTMMTSFLVSLLRNVIPSRVRMVAYMVIISTFVIAVDQFLQGFFPSISAALGPYVGLIITNCIVMGRAEAFAISNKVSHSVLDAFANGMGYMFTLIVISVIREVLAFGSILGVRVLAEGSTQWIVMAMAPGGFFVLATYLWIMRSITKVEIK